METGGVRELTVIVHICMSRSLKSRKKRNLTESGAYWQAGMQLFPSLPGNSEADMKKLRQEQLRPWCFLLCIAKLNNPSLYTRLIFSSNREIMVRSCIYWTATWSLKWRLHRQTWNRAPKQRNFINIQLEPWWKKGLLCSQNNLTDTKDDWSKGWNKTKTPNIQKPFREDSLQPEQRLHGGQLLGTRAVRDT